MHGAFGSLCLHQKDTLPSYTLPVRQGELGDAPGLWERSL